MFRIIGMKFIDPNWEESKDSEQKEMERIRKQTVKINKQNEGETKDKKGCC
jgi:hypothetical protein